MVSIPGLMALNLKETGKIIKSQDSVFTIGRMAELTKAIGKTTTCTEREHTNGQIKENIKDSMLKIKRKAMASIGILMEDATKECGRLGSNMEKVFLSLQTVKKKEENGKRANACTGSTTDKTQNSTRAPFKFMDHDKSFSMNRGFGVLGFWGFWY